MAILKIGSDFKDFSFAIGKNPASPMMVRTLRQGVLFGFYSKDKNQSEYTIYFKENGDSLSFANEFDHNDHSQYSSAYVLFSMMKNILGAMLKPDDSLKGAELKLIESKGSANYLEIASLFVKNESFFRKICSLAGLNSVTLDNIGGRVFRVRFESSEALNTFFKRIYLALYTLEAIFGNLGAVFDSSLQEKIALLAKDLNVGYYLRYLLLKEMFKEESSVNSGDFIKIRDHLVGETSEGFVQLMGGDTQYQRKSAIMPMIANSNFVLDVGCGEGDYSLRLKKAEKVFAVDKDSQVLDIVAKKINKKGIGNVVLFNSLDAAIEKLPESEKVTAICVEVIEHMPKEEAICLLKEIVGRVNFDKLIVTTPNAEFNKFYRLEGFRHDDHCWEDSKSEFVKLIEGVSETLKTEFFDIGDKVDGVSPSVGVVIYKY